MLIRRCKPTIYVEKYIEPTFCARLDVWYRIISIYDDTFFAYTFSCCFLSQRLGSP